MEERKINETQKDYIQNRVYSYTKDQELAKEKIINWATTRLSSIDDNFYILECAAGTGKTTLLRDIVKELTYLRIIATAPTHKAVHVLGENINADTSTIHKLLGLRPNFNIESLDKKNFEQSGEPKMSEYDLLIIDESSMIPKELENLIIKEARHYKTRVIYVGDRNQLPAVDSNSVFLNSLYKHKSILKEIIRQEIDNPLLILLNLLREDIENDTFKFISYIERNKINYNNNKGFEVLDRNELASRMIKEFKSESFSKDTNYLKYLSYTNNNIIQWNKFIRNTILNTNEILDMNDLLLGYENVMDEFNKTKIINSEEYYINSLEKTTFGDIEGFKVKTVSLFDNKVNEIFIADHTNPTFQVFVENCEALIISAKSAYGKLRKDRWKDYFTYKNKISIMVNVDLQYDIIKKDIDYGYALTIHKSQGSTYTNSYVNMFDILYPNNKVNKNPDLIKRLLYVAISRAKSNVLILNK